jgi:hypothetical protein
VVKDAGAMTPPTGLVVLNIFGRSCHTASGDALVLARHGVYWRVYGMADMS